jgi:hypothetical protein
MYAFLTQGSVVFQFSNLYKEHLVYNKPSIIYGPRPQGVVLLSHSNMLQIVIIFPWLIFIPQFLLVVDLNYSGLHILLIEQAVICAGTQVTTTLISSHNVPKRQAPE